jgi:hypothetical protein
MTLVIIVFTYLILMSNFLSWRNSESKVRVLFMQLCWNQVFQKLKTVWAYAIEFVKFPLVLRQFSGDYCRMSDIIRVHPVPSFVLPSVLQIHLRPTTSSSLEELMIILSPKKNLLCIVSFIVSLQWEHQTVAPINVTLKDKTHHIAYRIAAVCTLPKSMVRVWDRKKKELWGSPVPVILRPQRISHAVTWDQIQSSAVRIYCLNYRIIKQPTNLEPSFKVDVLSSRIDENL